MAITFVRLKEYLDAVAAQGNLDPAGSGHGAFWDTDYTSFIHANVPSKHCAGQNVPVINQADKVNSAFFLILQGGWCAMPQMPRTGPYVSDPGYTITLGDGSVVPGKQILQDIHDWLAGGALENG